MTNRLKLWKEGHSWESSEKEWDLGAKQAAQQAPIQGLSHLPQMVGITAETAKGLKWKALKWMVAKDHDRKILRGFLKHPFRYGYAWIKSVLRGKSYQRQGDFFLYGIDTLGAFQRQLEKKAALLVVGFSYCHKPFECPSGRFTPQCIHDPEHPTCRQCFIGKALNALPEKNSAYICIPTIHHIGAEIFRLIDLHPTKELIFMITACEMTLEMFGDWGNMVGIKGLGIRLDGRICNTMRAFELSEGGVKPGLTVVLEPTQRQVLELIRTRRRCME